MRSFTEVTVTIDTASTVLGSVERMKDNLCEKIMRSSMYFM